jgi:hypothetical protein
MDQIDQAFGKIYNMFGNLGQSNLSTGGSGASGISPQPISGSDNSLTAYFRGLSNLAGTTGANMLQAGGNLLGTGTGITQGGLDITGSGLQILQDPTQFYQKLLSGDPSTVTSALAPTAANISQIYTGAQNQASQGMPQGGYRAATMATLPQAQAAQVGNAALAQQAAAAQGLTGIGTDVAEIGGQVAQAGLGEQQLGTVLTGQALQTLQNTIADMMQKMGINIQGGTANQFATIVGAL